MQKKGAVRGFLEIPFAHQGCQRMHNQHYDLIFKNGTIVDGSSQAPYLADVGICGDKISCIGDLSSCSASQSFDIKGLILSPGFIDVHTHDDNAVLKSPNMLPKISQGVTSVIVGNCGISSAPLRLNAPHTHPTVPDPINLLGEYQDFIYPDFQSYVAHINQVTPAVNVAALVGHSTLRVNHMTDTRQTASTYELVQMKEELARCLAQGAIGLSSGLAYAIAKPAHHNEIKELLEVVGEKKGIYTTHLRNEFDLIIDALEEAFAAGRHGQVPVILSHHKCAGPDNWGRTTETLALIDTASKQQSLHLDCYPYAAGSSTLDLGQIDERINIMLTWSTPHPECSGLFLKDIAAKWAISEYEAGVKLQPAGAIYFSMHENDVQNVLSNPKTMIGSDGLPEDPHPHPRLWGTFPRVIGHYCRDLKLFNLQTAIHKMTGLSATNFKLQQRGFIKEGYFADLTIFDYQRITDVASFEIPQQQSEGIEYVVVNGVLTYQGHSTGGTLTGQRAGRYIG